MTEILQCYIDNSGYATTWFFGYEPKTIVWGSYD